MNRILKAFSIIAIVTFTLAACTGTQATPTDEEPTVEEAPSEPTAAVAPAPEEPAAGPDMLWSAAYGTDSAEKVQRGIATSDGGILAIGNTDEAGVEVGLPRPGDTLDVSAMDKTVELLYGEYVVGMEATLEAGTTTVAASKYAEDFYWEEYVFWEDNYFGWMREIYDTGWIVENWDDTCEIDEEAGTITYDYTDPDGELVTVVVQYGIVENEETGAVTVYIQEGDKVFILPSGGESRLSDILVIKVAESPGGEIERLWQKTFGTPDQHDVGYQLLELDDGYIIVGGVYVSEDYPQERYIAKLDKDDGSIIWEQTFDSDLLGYDEPRRCNPRHHYV
jgi:hypothetical protein